MKLLNRHLFLIFVMSAAGAPSVHGQAASQPASRGAARIPTVLDPRVLDTRVDPSLIKPDISGGPEPFGLSGIGNLGPPILPDNAKSDRPGLVPATVPGASSEEATGTAPGAGGIETFTDPLFVRAWQKFHLTLYRECADMLRGEVQGDKAGPECRALYIAVLVANGQMSSAGFAAVQAAKADPKNFFATVRHLAAVYRVEPDFSVQYEAAKKDGYNARNLEPGLLWAFYQQVEGSEENNPGVTLALLRPGPDDADWFQKLEDSLKKRPAKTNRPK